jgi:hypothetical protein
MRLVVLAVPGLLGSGAVVTQAVGFDGQVEIGPEEVDAMPVARN